MPLLIDNPASQFLDDFERDFEWNQLVALSPMVKALAGAELLDQKMPGWEYTINYDALDIESIDDCILAQLYGGYLVGLDELGLRWTNHGAYAHGFAGGSDVTEAWKTLIAERVAS